jgi:hypothetical protein
MRRSGRAQRRKGGMRRGNSCDTRDGHSRSSQRLRQVHVKRQVEFVVHWPAPRMAMQVASYRRAADRWIAFEIYDARDAVFQLPGSGYGGAGAIASWRSTGVCNSSRSALQRVNSDLQRFDGMVPQPISDRRQQKQHVLVRQLPPHQTERGR